MRLFFVISLLVLASAANAQTGGGSQDSSVTGHLRPRWGTYIVGCFPSPARANAQIKIQIYNNDSVPELSLNVYDLNNRPVLRLASHQAMPGGLHTFEFPADELSTGVYFVKLITYVGSSTEDVVDIARFVIDH